MTLSSSIFSISEHGRFACSNDNACVCDASQDQLITPPMNWSGYTTIYLEVATYFRAWSNSRGTNEISTDGKTWTTAAPIYTASTWQKHRVNLNA